MDIQVREKNKTITDIYESYPNEETKQFRETMDKGLFATFAIMGIDYKSEYHKPKLEFCQRKCGSPQGEITRIKIMYGNYTIGYFSWLDKDYGTTVFQWPLLEQLKEKDMKIIEEIRKYTYANF